MRKFFPGLALAAVLAGCAGLAQWTDDVNRKQAANLCVQAGYTETHARHGECVENTLVAMEAQRQRETQETLAGGLLVGGAIGHGYADAQAARAGYYGDSASLRICPDGSYVYGSTCYMAPDGTYHAGPVQIAPDGSYVSGSPRMAPDGSYVSGSGNIIICPDGSYATGQYCSIAPDGSYVGVP